MNNKTDDKSRIDIKNYGELHVTGDVTGRDKVIINNKTSITSFLTAIENIFKAIFLLIFFPKNCFQEGEDGYLTCSGISAFHFWFYTFIFEIAISAFAAQQKDFFNIWYFVAMSIYGISRIVFLSTITALFGMIASLNFRHLISITLFQIGLFSAIFHIIITPVLFEVGFIEFMVDSAIPPDKLSEFKNIITFGLSFMYVGVIYQIVYVSSITKISIFHSILLFISVNFTYTVLREVTVIPALRLLKSILINPPW